ncbi:CRAL-TRIO domain-containing protein [Chiua virens]|nr:CRAL-TRIO domain-containing protein [Chiua virens]
MSDILHVLHHNNHNLLCQYNTARPDLAALVDVVKCQLVSQLQLELALPDHDTAWLSEWLSDIGSIFRIFKRHKFTHSSALQVIRAISIWRLRTLRPILLIPSYPLFHCLPSPIADPFGRPIVFLRLASLQTLTCSIKEALLQEVERLRLHLRHVRDLHPHTGSFPLQYIVLVDLDGISIQYSNLDFDLFSWILTDIVPRYPGMLAAVFLLNYSWIHSGAWSVARHVLPSSTIARVFFPSKAQLLTYFSAASLPADLIHQSDYGGTLPSLGQIDDPLRSLYQTHLPPPQPSPVDLLNATPRSPRVLGEHPISPPATPSAFAPKRASSTIALPPFSPQNPFFGYPAVASASSPHTIRHVRRGLRGIQLTLVERLRALMDVKHTRGRDVAAH